MFPRSHSYLAGLLLVAYALWSAWRYWDAYAIDLAPLYIAGHFAANGEWHMIYGGEKLAFAVKNAPEWRGVLEAHGISGRSGSHYVYPPIWAYVVSPLTTVLDPQSFINYGRIVLAFCLSASIWLAWLIFRSPCSPVLWVALSLALMESTMPAVLSLELGQPQLLVILLVLASFERSMAGRDIQAGFFLGLAAAIKVSPILLIVIFLADRRWKAACVAVATSAGVAVASLLVAGTAPHFEFVAVVRWMDSLMPAVGLNFTFETVAHDFLVSFTPCERCSDARMGVGTPWVSTLSSALLLASLGAAVVATRRIDPNWRLPIRLTLISMAILFFGPLSWMHYYTVLLLLAPGILLMIDRRLALLLGGVIWLGFSKFWMGMLLLSNTRFPYDTIYPQHTAILSVLAMLVATAIFARTADNGTCKAS